MKNKRIKRLLALFMAIMLTVGLVYNRMPDVRADNTISFLNFKTYLIDTGIVDSVDIAWNMAEADYNAAQITTSGVMCLNASYEITGYTYDATVWTAYSLDGEEADAVLLDGSKMQVSEDQVDYFAPVSGELPTDESMVLPNEKIGIVYQLTEEVFEEVSLLKIASDGSVSAEPYTDGSWTNTDVMLKVKVSSALSGASLTVKNTTGEELTPCAVDESTGQLSYKIEGTDGATEQKNYQLVVGDEAGTSPAMIEKSVKIDREAPCVAQYVICPETENVTAASVTMLDYGFFYKEDTDVQVVMSDGQGSQIAAVTYSLMTSDGQYYVRDDVTHQALVPEKLDDNVAKLTIPAGFKGRLVMELEDGAGNQAQYHPAGFVIETKKQHEQAFNIGREVSAAAVITTTGNVEGVSPKLFGTEVELKLRAIDKISGIRKMSWRVVDGSGEQLLAGEADTQTGENVEGTKEEGIYKELTKTVTVDAEDVQNAHLELVFTDNAGHQSAVSSEAFTIDASAPEKGSVTLTKPSYTAEDKKCYYASGDAVEFQYRVQDDNSGIVQAELVLEKEGVQVGNTVTVTYAAVTQQAVTTMAVSDFGITTLEKGSYQIKARIYNRTGYVVDYTPAEFYVDTTAPECISYKVEKEATTAQKVLNILTFGIYSNDNVRVTVKTTDSESGVESIIWKNAADKKASEQTVRVQEDNTAVLVLSERTLYQLVLYAEDHVRNREEPKQLSELVNEAGGSVNGDELIIEEKAPQVTLTPENEAYRDGNTCWYKSFVDVTVSLNISDGNEPASGIAKYRLDVNQTTGVMEESFAGEAVKKLSCTEQFKGSSHANLKTNGRIELKAFAQDNAGNVSETVIREVYVDENAPVINGFEFLLSNGMGQYALVTESSDYGYFFDKQTNVRVHASDPQENTTAGSGVKEIELQLFDAVSQTVEKSEVKAVQAGTDYAEFTIPAGFKGMVSARAKDYVDNQNQNFVNPDQVVIETKDQHEQAFGIGKEVSAAAVITTIGNVEGVSPKLFGTEVELKLRAIDKISGIRKMSWRVVDGSGEQLLAGEADTQTGENVEGTKEEGIYKELTKTVTVDAEDVQNAHLELVFTDNAGHQSAVSSEAFTIDASAPEKGSVTLTKPSYTAEDKKCYYASGDSVEFQYCVQDDNSGIVQAELVLERNGKQVGNTVTDVYEAVTEKTTTVKTIRDFGITELAQGSYQIKARIYNRTGYVVDYTPAEFYVDTTAPECISYKVEKNSSVAEKVLNILTFGIYSNDTVTVTVTVEDKAGQINTGIRKIEVTNLANAKKVFEKSYTHKDYQGTTVCSFELDKFDEDGLYQLQIRTFDKVGNAGREKKLSELMCTSGDDRYITDNELILEKTAPVIDTLATSGYQYIDTASREWYASYNDIYVKIEAGDYGKHVSGLNEVRVLADGQRLAWSADYSNARTKTKAYSNGNKPLYECYGYQNINQDGSVRLEVQATDHAGNTSMASKKTVYVDEYTPYVTQFEFYASDSSKEGSETPVVTTDYGFFFQTATNVVIHTRDDGPSSGINYVTFKLVDEAGNVVKEERKNVDNNSCAAYVVDAGFKGQIYARVIDQVGHESGDVHPNGVVAESPQQHEADAYVNVARPHSDMKAVNGLELYSGDINLVLTAKDHISGIDSIEWSVVADGTQVQGAKLQIAIDGSVTGDAGWNGMKNANLVTELSKNISVTDNANSITVRLKMTDRSGYEKLIETSFSIDKTAPAISVIYDNNTPDAANTQYFNGARHATVVVTERNFDPEKINFNITNTDSVMPVISGWSEAAGSSANGDDTTHTCVISYEADGDYVFDISMMDRAGYTNLPIDYANSVAPQQFTIDRTIPVMQISYDSSELANTNYSKTQRTATVTIQEHNFNEADIVLTSTASDGADAVAFPQLGSFSTSGDVHTATLHFEKDAQYQYQVAYTDMAGNVAQALPEEEFVVDLKAPQVRVTNGNDTILDTTGNVDNRIAVFTKGAQILPVVEIMDRNFDAAATTVTLSGRNGKAIECSVEEISNASGSGKRYLFEELEDIYENDGAYTLAYKTMDKAGNESVETWEFKVNRHGTQLNTGELKSLNGAIYNGSGMIINGKKNQPYVLTLTCAQRLQSIRVLLGNIELKESQYKLGNPVELENGMFEYRLELLDEAFARDGDYHLAIYTLVEGANEEQELFSYWGEDLLIVVDSTSPEQRVRDLKDDTTYNMNEKTFDIVVDDAHLETLVVTLNGESEEFSVDELEKSGETEYTLHYKVMARDSAKNQTLALEGRDIAGNTTKKFAIAGKNGEQTVEVASFMVTTSGWIIFVNKLREHILPILGMTAIILSGAGFVLWRRHKGKL